MKERVEDAAELLDSIIDDIVSELSAVQAIGFIYQEVPESTEKQIIKYYDPLPACHSFQIPICSEKWSNPSWQD